MIKTILMKRTISILFLSLLFVFIACKEDFMNIVPLDTVPENSFWKTKEDIDGAVNGIYSEFLSAVMGGTASTAALPTNDFYANEIQDLWDLIALKFTATNGQIYWIWSTCYTSIARANRVIARTPKMPINADYKAIKLAEAKCLRGYFYYTLIAAYGGVPLILDEQTATSDPNPIRAPLTDVLRAMIKDFTEAAADLPAKWDDNNVGRVTKGTALTMLGLTNLYLEDWNASIKSFEDLEAMGTYKLLPNYMDQFKYGQENTEESILECQFSDTPESGNYWQSFFGPRDAGDAGATSATWGIFFPTQKLLKSLEPGDDRRKQFLTPGEKITLPANNFVYTMQGEGKSAKTDVVLIKFWAGHPASNNLSGQNILMLKYSTAIMYYAEALAHAGRFADAYTQINRIRTRAKLSNKTVVNDLETCITDINKERRIENCFEVNGFWYDLTRTKQAKKFLKEQYNIEMDDYKYLFPIPQSQLDLDKNLEQNPGYN